MDVIDVIENALMVKTKLQKVRSIYSTDTLYEQEWLIDIFIDFAYGRGTICRGLLWLCYELSMDRVRTHIGVYNDAMEIVEELLCLIKSH